MHTDSILSHVNDVGPWYTVDGTPKMFENRLSVGSPSPSNHWTNENGVAIDKPFAWTGMLYPSQSEHYCGDWTTSTTDGGLGLLTIALALPSPCNTLGSPFCVEQ